MRIHSDVLTYKLISDALIEQKQLGRIAKTVYFGTLGAHGSRKRKGAFEVKLASFAKETGDGRRFGNSGGYGSTSQTDGDYAATYDEWGWFLAALYKLDPEMVVPYYDDVHDFYEKTGSTYDPEWLLQYFNLHGEDPYPYVYRKPQAGRIGYNRVTEDRAHFTAIWSPRTVEDITKFSEGVYK